MAPVASLPSPTSKPVVVRPSVPPDTRLGPAYGMHHAHTAGHKTGAVLSSRVGPRPPCVLKRQESNDDPGQGRPRLELQSKDTVGSIVVETMGLAVRSRSLRCPFGARYSSQSSTT